MNFLGISRSPIYSPHSEERDAQIFNQVSAALQARGHQVVGLSEDEFETAQAEQKILAGNEDWLIFTMGRHPQVLQKLESLQKQGYKVVNSAAGILQLSRRSIYSACQSLGVNVPRQYSDVECERLGDLSYPCWLKRDDACAQQSDDVCFVSNREELQIRLQAFAQRGVAHYVVSEHKAGDLIKFYGVAGTSFFYSYSPKSANGFSKFGLEVHNDNYRGFAFDVPAWQQQMNSLALQLQVPVYGGDAIVDEHGQCFLIDFNDWPSFSCCRDKAVVAIADCLEQMAENTK